MIEEKREWAVKLITLFVLLLIFLFPFEVESGKVNFFTRPPPWRIMVAGDCECWLEEPGGEIVMRLKGVDCDFCLSW